MIQGGKGEQLKMFMTPNELMNYAKPYDKADIETVEQMWQRKERESLMPQHHMYHGGGVYDSIAQHGVTSHVDVWHEGEEGPGIGDGHHRIAAAAAVERNLGRQQFIPIEHHSEQGNWDPRFSYERRYPQNVRHDWR